jgi:hypothetical protein
MLPVASLRLALLVSLPLSLAARAPSQAVIRTHTGASGQQLGTAVASAGDVDMDGYDDVIVGSPMALGGRGSAEVRSGRNGAVLLSISGVGMFDRMGTAVAGAGDVNGDGRDDVVVGAPNAPFFALAPGYVVVLSGADGSELHRITGAIAGDRLGLAVSGAGDADDDGYDDFAVGAPSVRVDIYSGRTGGLIRSIPSSGGGVSQFGTALALVGDLDRDGFDDLLIGAPNANASGSLSGSGHARVVSLRTGATLFSRDGDSLSDAFGTSVAGGFDATGDGVPDFVVGAPGDDNNGSGSGSVRLFSGATGLAVLTRDGAGGDALGTSVAMPGDMDGDGRSEFAAGAPQPPFISPTLPGYVRVYSSTGITLFTATGDAVDDRMGTSVSAAGDVDRNGLADLIAGAPLAASDGGIARIFRRNSTVDAGRLEDYGRACPAADGRLPRLTLTGRPSLGQSYSIGVRSAPASAPGILRIAFGRNNLDLAFIGAPQCLLLTQFFVDLTIGTTTAGRAAVTLPIAPNPSTIGLVVDYQWSLLAPGANALGIITSDGGELTIGQG